MNVMKIRQDKELYNSNFELINKANKRKNE